MLYFCCNISGDPQTWSLLGESNEGEEKGSRREREGSEHGDVYCQFTGPASTGDQKGSQFSKGLGVGLQLVRFAEPCG